jgi:hypothetical protein
VVRRRAEAGELICLASRASLGGGRVRHGLVSRRR